MRIQFPSMNSPGASRCNCAHPSGCLCPNSRWFNPALLSRPQPPRPSPSRPSNATPFLPSLHHGYGPQTPSSSSSYPAHLPLGYHPELSSSFQWQHAHPSVPPGPPMGPRPHYQSPASQQSAGYFPSPQAFNSIPFPLSNVTAAAVNSQSAPRKRTNAPSSGARPTRSKKARTSATASQTAAPTVTSEPNFTAAVVGVGPTVPISDTPSSSTSRSDIPVNSTYEAIEKVVGIAKKKKANRSDGAMDVWYFVVPLETIEMDAKGAEMMKKIQDMSYEVPLINAKPNSPFVACRFCLKE